MKLKRFQGACSILNYLIGLTVWLLRMDTTRKEKLALTLVACTQITPNWTYPVTFETMCPQTSLQKEIHL